MSTDDPVRTFVCVEIPDTERQRLANMVARLRRHGARVAWVPPENAHLTLAFLGGIPARRLPRVADATARACRTIDPFDLSLAGTGCFPSGARPKVLWTGVVGDLEALERLQRRVGRELAAEGFELDSKPFRPHLTIGRVKEDRGPAIGGAVRELAAAALSGAPFRIVEAVVMRSDLSPAGARYTPLARVQLRGTGTAEVDEAPSDGRPVTDDDIRSS